jgi:hypothetical protein
MWTFLLISFSQIHPLTPNSSPSSNSGKYSKEKASSNSLIKKKFSLKSTKWVFWNNFSTIKISTLKSSRDLSPFWASCAKSETSASKIFSLCSSKFYLILESSNSDINQKRESFSISSVKFQNSPHHLSWTTYIQKFAK